MTTSNHTNNFSQTGNITEDDATHYLLPKLVTFCTYTGALTVLLSLFFNFLVFDHVFSTTTPHYSIHCAIPQFRHHPAFNNAVWWPLKHRFHAQSAALLQSNFLCIFQVWCVDFSGTGPVTANGHRIRPMVGVFGSRLVPHQNDQTRSSGHPVYCCILSSPIPASFRHRYNHREYRRGSAANSIMPQCRIKYLCGVPRTIYHWPSCMFLIRVCCACCGSGDWQKFMRCQCEPVSVDNLCWYDQWTV